MERTKVTIPQLRQMKQTGKKITMLTAYDYPTALLLDKAGIDLLLVGDSVGNVVLGYDSTVPVTMDEMVHHTKAVRRGTQYAFLTADMPFLSFHITPEQTIANAGRLVKEAGAEAVKIEGASSAVLRMIEAVIAAGIPVMGHVGLTPQTATSLGGYKVQGKTPDEARQLIAGARQLEKVGCFVIVLECVPEVLAQEITRAVKVPTIGIGAGVHCDGQVLVTHDMLGLQQRFAPKFVKRYAELGTAIRKAAQVFIAEVQEKKFPDASHSYVIDNASAFAKKKRS